MEATDMLATDALNYKLDLFKVRNVFNIACVAIY